MHGATAMGARFPARTDAERREMHCGFVPRSEWVPLEWFSDAATWPRGGRVGVSRLLPAGVEYATRDPDSCVVTPDVCPGFVAQGEFIGEVVRVWEAFEKGALESLFPMLGNREAEGAMELARASNAYQAQRQEGVSRELEEKRNRG